MRTSIVAARVGDRPNPSGDEGQFEFRFPPADPVFAGHFPGRPVLPGVLQIEMARLAAGWALGRNLAILEISRAKFLRPILPDELVRLNLKITRGSDGPQVRAKFSVGGEAAGETILRCAEVEMV